MACGSETAKQTVPTPCGASLAQPNHAILLCHWLGAAQENVAQRKCYGDQMLSPVPVGQLTPVADFLLKGGLGTVPISDFH